LKSYSKVIIFKEGDKRYLRENQRKRWQKELEPLNWIGTYRAVRGLFFCGARGKREIERK